MSSQSNVIVITGGAGGIGQACARVFKNQSIIITDYSQEMVDKTVKSFSKEDFDITGIACDITDKNDVIKLTEFVKNRGSLKALIHTAGVSGTVKTLEKCTL